MGVFVPFENGVQVELVFVLDSQIVTNRLWFWNADHVADSAELVALADGVYEWHTTYILPALSSDLQLVTVVARNWNIPDQVGEVTTFPSVNGSVVEQSHSANVAIVVGFRWALQYSRLKRNKNYVPGIPLSSVTLNTPVAGIQDDLFEGYSALIDWARTITPGDFWYWVTASAISASAPRSEMLFAECTGPLPRSRLILGQRRRRLPAGYTS